MFLSILSLIAAIASVSDEPKISNPTGSAPAAPQAASTAPVPPTVSPKAGDGVRVGGDLTAAVTKKSESLYVAGRCTIDTPLPDGYPMPTPEGAIEIKTYPMVRRAEVTGKMAPNIGMNLGFWPLFNHIKSRDIAMTSPVEMNFTGTDKPVPDGGDAVPATWTMSFLYRSPELGPTGQDEQRKNVKVVDVPPVTVVALGVRGGYDYSRMQAKWKELETWLSEQRVWDAAGEPRVLYYNGPNVRNADKWAEVQIPIRLVTEKAETKSPDEQATAPSTPPASAPGSTTRD